MFVLFGPFLYLDSVSRAKSARVITFEQFNQALTELAPKRFKDKSKEEAVQQIYDLIAGKGPANVGITVSTNQFVLHYCCQDGLN